MNDLVGQVREQIKDIRNSQRSIQGGDRGFASSDAEAAAVHRADRQQGQEIVARQATAASQAKQAAEKLDAIW